MEDGCTNIELVGDLKGIETSLRAFLSENCINDYKLNVIQMEEYVEIVKELPDKSRIFIFSSKEFLNIKHLKNFKLDHFNKYILIVDQEESDFIKLAQAKGFDIFYVNSSIDNLVYKITNTYRYYKEEFKYRNINELPAEKRGKIITVYSPKGGTGKTTLTINIGLKYVEKGLKTLIIDFSQYSCIHTMLNKESEVGGLSKLLAQLEKEEENNLELDIEQTLKDSIKQYELEKMKIDVLAGAQPLKIDKITPNITREIIRGVRNLDYDVIIIDTSSELSIRNVVAFELSDSILLVSSADVYSGLAILQFKEIINTLGLVSKCKLVINQYEEAMQFSYLDLENELQIPVITVLPCYKQIQFYSNMGKIIGLDRKDKINSYFKKVAHAFMPIFSETETKIKRFIFR